MSIQPGPGASVRLRALRAEQITDDAALTLRRGCTTLRVEGANAAEIVTTVFDLTAGEGKTEEELVSHFDPAAEASIRALVRELRARRLLLPADGGGDAGGESPLDVFYWHFGLPDEQSPKPPEGLFVPVVGQGATARRLCAVLEESGFDEVVLVEELADGSRRPEVLVAVSESEGFAPIRRWNRICLERELPFLPVVIEDLVVFVGPLVVPGQTACFECFLSRRYSNLDEASVRKPVELHDGTGRVAALHPAICGVAADAAALELAKFFLPWHGGRQVGHLLTFNLLASVFGRHRVLKVPRCPACSGLRRHQSTTIFRSELPDDAL